MTYSILTPILTDIDVGGPVRIIPTVTWRYNFQSHLDVILQYSDRNGPQKTVKIEKIQIFDSDVNGVIF